MLGNGVQGILGVNHVMGSDLSMSKLDSLHSFLTESRRYLNDEIGVTWI